jgi:energy-coupling factor transport system ATP-binding protein
MLRFNDYTFSYSGAKSPAISAVSLAIPAGLVVSVIAPQGKGKTTLQRAAAGLLGEIYQGEVSGSIERDASARPGAFFEGYVQITLAVETVGEEIGLPLYAAGLSRPERNARVNDVARELRIEQLVGRNVTALSGGEEKLVGIAAALVPHTSLYILDEPFEQLDVMHIAAVIRAAKRRAAEGRLVLVSTGSIDTAINIADAAIVFDGTAWRLIHGPTYADLAVVPQLGASALGEFLHERHVDASGVRRFRDGVVKVS